MPDDPDYLSPRNGVQGHSPIHGAEYHTNGPLSSLSPNQNAPCAVCYATTREGVMMIPAKIECPSSWTREYYGYLVSEWKNNFRSMFICVDLDAETIDGEEADTGGTPFHNTEATCNGLECPPYDPERELTCVVCTK